MPDAHPPLYCPRCGSDRANIGQGLFSAWRVRCPGCGATGFGVRMAAKQPDGRWLSAEEAAIHAWVERGPLPME